MAKANTLKWGFMTFIIVRSNGILFYDLCLLSSKDFFFNVTFLIPWKNDLFETNSFSILDFDLVVLYGIMQKFDDMLKIYLTLKQLSAWCLMSSQHFFFISRR
jgi:hypothetical protein